jgi:hypothetical protein
LAFGQSFTGKSTFAASGKGRKWYAEFDTGSFERTGLDEADFTIKRYPAPVSTLLERGKVSGAGVARELHGWDDLWWGFIDDYLNALDTHDSFIFDTGTKMWLINRNAYFERVQNEKDAKERERLSRLEYQEPNGQMDAVVEAAKQKGKSIIFVAHQGEVYLNDKPTGELKPDGYKELSNMADVTLHFSLRDKKPVARIFKIGAGGLELKDMELKQPTLESVDDLLSAATKLRRAGKELPGTPEDVIVAAMKL